MKKLLSILTPIPPLRHLLDIKHFYRSPQLPLKVCMNRQDKMGLSAAPKAQQVVQKLPVSQFHIPFVWSEGNHVREQEALLAWVPLGFSSLRGRQQVMASGWRDSLCRMTRDTQNQKSNLYTWARIWLWICQCFNANCTTICLEQCSAPINIPQDIIQEAQDGIPDP